MSRGSCRERDSHRMAETMGSGHSQWPDNSPKPVPRSLNTCQRATVEIMGNTIGRSESKLAAFLIVVSKLEAGRHQACGLLPRRLKLPQVPLA